MCIYFRIRTGGATKKCSVLLFEISIYISYIYYYYHTTFVIKSFVFQTEENCVARLNWSHLARIDESADSNRQKQKTVLATATTDTSTTASTLPVPCCPYTEVQDTTSLQTTLQHHLQTYNDQHTTKLHLTITE